VKIYSLLFFFTLTLHLPAQWNSKIAGQVDSLQSHWTEQSDFSGSLVIGNREGIWYQRSSGIANRSFNIRVRDATRFDICSLNKSFIGALCLLAQEEGKINLKDKLPDVLRKCGLPHENYPQVTLHQMLTHTSGLANYQDIEDSLKAENYLTFKRLHFSNETYAAFIARLPQRQANQQFYYSNFAYHLLPIILEEVYQISFEEILQQKILGPLNMTHTHQSVDNTEIIPELAEGYSYDPKAAEWHSNPFIDLTLGRRIFSTATDLFYWARSLSDTTLLSKESLAQMLTDHTSSISPEVSYGYGLAIHPANSPFKMGKLNTAKPYFIHGGATDGYRAMMVNVNDGELIFTFLSNVGDRTKESEISNQILETLYPNEN